MRLAVVVALAISGFALAQGTPRVPAHFKNRSVTTRHVFTQNLYVDGGTIYDGEVAAHSFANTDGGVVHAPAGVAVDTGYALCLNGAALCSSKVYQSPGNQLVLQGQAGITGVNGATFQGTLEAGSLSANSVELVGGATSATVRAASGTGATPDAKLYLQAGLPNGLVEVVRDAGISSRILVQPWWQLADIPPCDIALSGARLVALWPGLQPDGGTAARPQTCDGVNWVQTTAILDPSAAAKSGTGKIWRNNPRGPGKIDSISVSASTAGVGATPYQLLVRQGSRLLCSGGASCDSEPSLVPITCTDRLVYANLDGGLAQQLTAEIDAGVGCSQTPALGAQVTIELLGWPDPLWFPPE